MIQKPIDKFDGEYRWLSNFYPCYVSWEGLLFPTVEHAYQAAKSSDLEVWKYFQGVDAKQAKRKGKTTKIRPDWDASKLAVMEHLLRQKFSQNDFKQRLIETGDAELIEGNWWGDTFWGVCKGVGENHLGKLLMQIRAELNATETEKL